MPPTPTDVRASAPITATTNPLTGSTASPPTTPIPTGSPTTPAPRRSEPRELPPLRHTSARRLVAVARRLAGQPSLWEPYRVFDAAERRASRVAAGQDYEAWLLTWLPGQTTGLHDHGGSAGAFVVVEGSLQESVLAPPRRDLSAALVRRTLDAGRHRSFGAHHVHEVRCVGDTPAVSLHVYAPALASMRRYQLDHDGRAVIVAREKAGVDW